MPSVTAHVICGGSARRPPMNDADAAMTPRVACKTSCAHAPDIYIKCDPYYLRRPWRMVPGSRHLLLFLTTTLGHAPTETQVTATMPPVHSTLAASSASAAQTVEKFENAAQSYRVALSDEGIEDMVVECSGTPAKSEKGVVIEGQFDVKVEVSSAKESAKSSK